MLHGGKSNRDTFIIHGFILSSVSVWFIDLINSLGLFSEIELRSKLLFCKLELPRMSEYNNAVELIIRI